MMRRRALHMISKAVVGSFFRFFLYSLINCFALCYPSIGLGIEAGAALCYLPILTFNIHLYSTSPQQSPDPV